MQQATLRKNKLPAGRKTRCWVTLSGIPSLNQRMFGSGMPSALQFIVTGSLRGTVVSMGCSTIRGSWKAAKRYKRKENEISKIRIVGFPPFIHNLVSNLIKLKVLFSVFQRFSTECCCFCVHSFFIPPQSNYGFSAPSVAKPTKHQMALKMAFGSSRF